MMQLTPTASWWFKIGTNEPFMKAISLGSTTIVTDPMPVWFGWTIMRDHWAIDENITDLAVTLGAPTATSEIVVSRKHAGQPPTQGLIDDAGEVADPEKFRFQIKAKSTLSIDDWEGGEPPMGGGMKIFYQKKGSIDDTSPRLLLELTVDKKNLARITWLVRERHEGFEKPFTLENKALPTNWEGWFYYSVETVY